MNSEHVAKTSVTIKNPQGLHARPADLFARTASGFQSEIRLTKDGYSVDGKSILSLLTLVAEHGTQLGIEAQGPDADAALATLVQLVDSGFSQADDDTTTEPATEVEPQPQSTRMGQPGQET